MSWVHWIVVAGVAMILFGRGNGLSNLMGELAKGIRSFQRELKGPAPVEARAATADSDRPGRSEEPRSAAVRDSASGSRDAGGQAHEFDGKLAVKAQKI
jgi:sec-independent protein translocase protein TatA